MNQINTEQLINFLLSQQQSEKSVDISNAYKIYIDYVKLHKRAGTLDSYTTALKPVIKFLYGKKIFKTSDITTDVINQFVLSRKPFVKNQTINREIKYLKAMLHYMIKCNYIDKINFIYEPLKYTKTKIPRITDDSIKKILNYFDESNKIETKSKLIFLLILTTGIRTSELLNIENKNIDLVNNFIKLDFTKNGESRNIYIVDQVKPLVVACMNKTRYLFIDEHNKKMTANALRCIFKRLKDTLNIDILSPHKLRHYYATNIYNKSLDICLVKELLGHKSIMMTQIYLDIDNHDNQAKNSYYSPLNDFRPTDWASYVGRKA